jgi:hypothetical protein
MQSRSLKLITMTIAVASALYACHSDDALQPLAGSPKTREVPSRSPSSFVGTTPVTGIDDIPITPMETVAAAPN